MCHRICTSELSSTYVVHHLCVIASMWYITCVIALCGIPTYVSMHLYIYLCVNALVYLPMCQCTCISTYVSMHFYLCVIIILLLQHYPHPLLLDKSGMEGHKLGLVILLSFSVLLHSTNSLDILSFNIRQFGTSKYSKQNIVDILLQVHTYIGS